MPPRCAETRTGATDEGRGAVSKPPTREKIERRFVAQVVMDADGDRLRENLKLLPAAFESFEAREAWRVLTKAGSIEKAASHPDILPFYKEGGTGVTYLADRNAVWMNWLNAQGPEFESEWISRFQRTTRRLPATETEPPEAEILPDPVALIDGLIEPGDKMIISSGSKSFKTWLLIQLACCVASGIPFLGHHAKRGAILFLNFEIKPRNFWRRVYRVRRKLGLAESNNFHVWNLRGKGFSLDEHAAELIARAKACGACLVLLDPLYKLLGNRNESAAGEMAGLMSLIDRVATETGAAVVFAHHFAKGSAAGKDAMDRASGSGVFARDPDCIVALTPLDEAEGANTFQVSVTLRDFAPIDNFGIRREHPLMIRDDAVNVSNLHDPGKRKAKYSVDEVVGLLPPSGLTSAEWQKDAAEKLGMSRSTFFETYKPKALPFTSLKGSKYVPARKSDQSDLVRLDHRTRSESGIKNTGPDQDRTEDRDAA